MRKATITFLMSVHPHGTKWFPLGGFSWNLIFEYFSSTCRRNSSFIKNSTRITGTLHEDQCTVLTISYQFFLEWQIFQTTFVEKFKTHILCLITFFRKSCRFWDNVRKYCRVGRATDDNMPHAGYLRLQTHTQTCDTYRFSTAAVVTRTRLIITLYAHCLSCC